jgi:hypothetical protein
MGCVRAAGLMLIGSAVACAGCEGSPPDLLEDTDPQVEVVDSAGVELVRNLDPAPRAARADLELVLRIGTREGRDEEQFHGITGVAEDGTGQILVIERGAQSVRIFDGSGRFVRRFGGAGEGPGEFQAISWLFVRGDTVHAADARWRSGAVFDTTGTLLFTYLQFGPEGSSLFPVAATDGGWVVQYDSLFFTGQNPGDGEQRMTRLYLIAAPDLERVAAAHADPAPVLRPIAGYAGPRTYNFRGLGGQRYYSTPFFEPSGSAAVDGRGRVYIAHGLPYLIDVYDVDGALIRRITRAHEPVPITNELVDAVLDRARSHYGVGGPGESPGTLHRFREEALTGPPSVSDAVG